MGNQLMVQGKAISLVKPNGIRHFVATKANISAPAEKETYKQVKERAIAKGVSKDTLSAWGKEYDGLRSNYYQQSALINGQLAADPRFRKETRIDVNKAGKVLGATTRYREERSSNATKDAEIASLRALVARLQGTPALQVA